MALKEKHKDKISEAFSNPDIITKALAQGVKEALIQHKRSGNPIVVWRDGKVVWLKPEEIPI